MKRLEILNYANTAPPISTNFNRGEKNKTSPKIQTSEVVKLELDNYTI